MAMPYPPPTPNFRRGAPNKAIHRAPSVAASEVEGDEYAYEGAGQANDDGFDKGTIEERESVLGHLKRSSSMRSEQFASVMETNRRAVSSFQIQIVVPWLINSFQSMGGSNAGGRNYTVRKGEDRNPYPGVIIEEMLDSASMQNGDYPVALIEDQPETKEPEVRPLPWINSKFRISAFLSKFSQRQSRLSLFLKLRSRPKFPGFFKGKRKFEH